MTNKELYTEDIVLKEIPFNEFKEIELTHLKRPRREDDRKMYSQMTSTYQHPNNDYGELIRTLIDHPNAYQLNFRIDGQWEHAYVIGIQRLEIDEIAELVKDDTTKKNFFEIRLVDNPTSATSRRHDTATLDFAESLDGRVVCMQVDPTYVLLDIFSGNLQGDFKYANGIWKPDKNFQFHPKP